MNKFKIEVNGSTEIERLRSVFVSLQTCPLNKLLQMKWKESVSDIMLLIGALVLFTRRDAGILFNEKKDVDERAMVGCVYRYMFCARLLNVLESTQPDIDIEYDRMRVVGKGLVPKYFALCAEPNESCKEHQYESCRDFIENHGKICDKCQQYEKRIRPDLIIHRRNSEPGSDNGMIAEFKRHDRGEGCDDMKILYSTCTRGTLKYKIGAKVILSSTRQIIELYKDSIKVDELDVSRDSLNYTDGGFVA